MKFFALTWWYCASTFQTDKRNLWFSRAFCSDNLYLEISTPINPDVSIANRMPSLWPSKLLHECVNFGLHFSCSCRLKYNHVTAQQNYAHALFLNVFFYFIKKTNISNNCLIHLQWSEKYFRNYPKERHQCILYLVECLSLVIQVQMHFSIKWSLPFNRYN